MGVVAWGVGGERRVEVASEESVLAEEEFLGRPIRLEARWQGADLAIPGPLLRPDTSPGGASQGVR